MTEADDLPEHVRRNRTAWDAWASDYVANGEASWRLARGDEKWGVWDIPERDVHLLPDDLAGRDTIELGCGTAYVSAWLMRRGAPVPACESPGTVVAVDFAAPTS